MTIALAHADRADLHRWVIAQIAPDFELLDVWALPAHGGRDGFDALLEIMASLDGRRVHGADQALPGDERGGPPARQSGAGSGARAWPRWSSRATPGLTRR